MTTEQHVLVGVDAHEDAPELCWAAAEAIDRGLSLRIACTYPRAAQLWPWDSDTERAITADLRNAAHRQAVSAQNYVQSRWPGLAVHGEAVEGHPAETLTQLSANAELTVVGSQHRTFLGRAFLDSVSSALAATASGPVVVVRPRDRQPAKDAEVVVGVDGFERTDDVLAFAFDYASRQQRPLHAVYCWTNEYGPTPRIPQPKVPERARRWLAELLDTWAQKYPEVEIRQTVNDNAPTPGLLSVADGQDLLVVGGRTSRHPRLITLLGSVSQGVVHHAALPVAVVHPRVRPE